MLKLRVFWVVVLLSVTGWSGQAGSQQPETDRHARGAVASIGNRYALVIGNSAYQYAPLLANGRSDATAVGQALKELGFKVTVGLDTDHNTLRELVGEFGRRLQPTDISLFYYAGHGLQANGANYLVPVDAALDRPADLPFEGERLDDVIGAMTVEGNTAIILLDACRNNPFVRNLTRANRNRSLDVGRGLAPVDAGRGVYIAFATQPGNVALDGEDGHSPFTAALLKHIATPAIDIEILMRRVRLDVMNASNQQQVPWSNSSLIEPGFSFDPSTGPTPEKEMGNEPNDRVFWAAIKDTSDVKLFRAYVAAFPSGAFIATAKERIAKLEKPATPKKKTPPHKKVSVTTDIKPQSTNLPTRSNKPANSLTQSTEPSTAGRCRDGNIQQCRIACGAGKRRACNMLRVLEKLQ